MGREKEKNALLGGEADIQCTTCGEEDKHDRKDCPFGLTCFNCGTPGHRSAVSVLCSSCLLCCIFSYTAWLRSVFPTGQRRAAE